MARNSRRSSFVKRTYEDIYKKELEDSPEEARLKAQSIISGHVRKLPDDAVYLGIGAGRGFLEATIYNNLKRLKRVILLDFAERKPLIKRTEAKGEVRKPNVVNLVADAQVLPVEGNSVDIISNQFTHDFTDDPDTAAREMHRVLKPGAKAVVFLHHPNMFAAWDDSLQSPKPDVEEFWRQLVEEKRIFSTEEEIRRHFSQHGFEIETVEEHVPTPKENPGNYWWEVILSKRK